MWLELHRMNLPEPFFFGMWTETGQTGKKSQWKLPLKRRSWKGNLISLLWCFRLTIIHHLPPHIASFMICLSDFKLLLQCSLTEMAKKWPQSLWNETASTKPSKASTALQWGYESCWCPWSMRKGKEREERGKEPWLMDASRRELILVAAHNALC